MKRYDRDLLGYGNNIPHAAWPNDATIAIQIVVNYEEGGERCILHGDNESEAFLSEIVGAAPWPNQRHWNMESIYEYGARAGFWRLYDYFTQHQIPITAFGVTTALEKSPAHLNAMMEAGWEMACHGLKWIEHKDMPIDEERAQIIDAIQRHEHMTGQKPKGWYTGRCSMNTVALVAEEAECLYQSDTYADDLPYWAETPSGPQLMIPYTMDTNDMRFSTPQGFNAGDQFLNYLKDSFDTLYEEGQNGKPKMMSVGLHCRLAGRPGRMKAIKSFVEYAKSHGNVWFTTRAEIAHHWRTHHPYQVAKLVPHRMKEDAFISSFGGVFEHSSWIAEHAFNTQLGPANDTAEGLHHAMCIVFRAASHDKRKDVLLAHPDLAGKLAVAGRLTTTSATEQNSAGLDMLTDDERKTFTSLNTQYHETFGFPFIIAVKGLTKDQIISAFKTRINHDQEVEFETACREVEKIARLRLNDLLP